MSCLFTYSAVVSALPHHTYPAGLSHAFGGVKDPRKQLDLAVTTTWQVAILCC